MNEREAREILNRDPHERHFSLVYVAQGYLEAIEKAKMLVDALENIRCEAMVNMPPPFDRARRFITREDMVCLADDVLQKWEKEK